MKKLWYAMSLLLVASLFLAACKPAATPAPTAAPAPTKAPEPTKVPDLLADIKARGAIKVSTDPNYAPQSFLKPDGSFEGFDVDVANEIGKRLGVKVEFVTPDWDVITAGNWGNQWDISVGSMTITTARSKILYFMTPYYYTPAQFAAAKGSGIRALEDLAGKAVCVGTATTYEDWLNGVDLGLPAESLYAEAPANVTVVPLSTDAECIQAIQAGRTEFQAVLTSNTVVEEAIRNDAPIYKVGTPVFSENLSVAVDRSHSKDPASLVAAIDKIVKDMHSDGTLPAFSQTWFSEDLTVDPTTIAAPEAPAIGTEDNPIKVLFVPSVEANVITTGGEVMAQALHEATGLYFEVTVPTSYAATIEEMCASPENSMGFIPGLGYALASQLCGVDVSFKAIRFGFPVYWTQFLVARDSNITQLSDLAGKKWAYPDPNSTSGYMVPTVMLKEAGITPGEQVQAGGHPQAALAVYRGEVDFATTFYSVPLNPDGKTAWSYADYLAGKVTGDMYELPAEVIESCAPSEDGKKLLCSGWRVLDARASARADAPDIMQKVRILTISPAIPNDTLAFGPDFPAELRAQIEAALLAFSTTEAWGQSIGSQDFYGWTGIEPAKDEEYDMVRAMVEATGWKP